MMRKLEPKHIIFLAAIAAIVLINAINAITKKPRESACAVCVRNNAPVECEKICAIENSVSEGARLRLLREPKNPKAKSDGWLGE